MLNEVKETSYGIVAKSWDFIRADRFCHRVTDGTHDSPKPQTAGKHLVTSKHIRGRNIDFDSAYLITEEEFNKINLRSKVDQWDVIISMIGEYCGFCYVERNEQIEYAVKNVGLFKTGDKVKALWLYYFLNSEIGTFILETNKSGTSQPYLSLGFLRELPVLYPPTDTEAGRVVEVLSSLDDKIDLLNRQNKTLEALAETLFRQWFIEEAEENWDECGLDEVADFLNGLPCQKYPAIAGQERLPVIKIKELRQGFTEASDWATENVPEEYLVNNGDILFSWSGSLEVVIWFYGKGILNQHLFKVTSEHFPAWFYFFWLKHHLEGFRTIAQDKATTMGHIQRHHLSSALVTIPTPPQMTDFDAQMTPIFQKLKRNLLQIRSLIQLRNTLLPKLMSGVATVSVE